MDRTEKPPCKLVGEDGNAFTIMGLVSRALKDADMREAATEYMGKATRCHSYDELLQLTMEYVEVE